MGVAVISILSIFGVAMTHRMIVDSDVTARMVAGRRSFFLADAGIQWGRCYLVSNNQEITLGPFFIAGGEVVVTIAHSTVNYPDDNTPVSVYRIISSAAVGPTMRIVEELRFRGGLTDKTFFLWREDTASDI